MKLLVSTLLSLLVFIGLAVAQDTLPPKTAVQKPILKVEVEGGMNLQFNETDLAKLPRIDVKAKDHDGKESAYSGFELREVMQLAGVKFGKDLRGGNLALFLTVEAFDAYRAVFALPELDPEFTDKKIILADKRDGKPLDARNGPWQIIVPDEKRHARWVRQVVALKVRKAN